MVAASSFNDGEGGPCGRDYLQRDLHDMPVIGWQALCNAHSMPLSHGPDFIRIEPSSLVVLNGVHINLRSPQVIA